MRVAITGASGFIGRHTVRALCAAGHDVVALARSPFAGAPPVEWQLGDLHFAPAWQGQGIDAVIHLAGSAASGDMSESERLAASALTWAAASGIPRFIHISTYAVWGDRATPAHSGDTRTPADAYAVAKAHAEDVVREGAKKAGIDACIVRLTSVYGEGGRGIIDIARGKLARDEEIVISSDFSNMFLHVEDVARTLSTITVSSPLGSECDLEGETLTGGELAGFLRSIGGRVAFQSVPGRRYAQTGYSVERSISVRQYLRSAVAGIASH